jgi:DNA processing protein
MTGSDCSIDRLRCDEPSCNDPSDAEIVDTLRLALISGVGPKTRKLLLDRFGSVQAVLEAAPSEIREVYGVGPKLLSKIVRAPASEEIKAEVERCRSQGIDILIESHATYPRMLREIHDPPGVLFLRGQFKPADVLAVAIVGTRHATHYGLRQAERLASGLARAGLTVVSGLARGIDAAAHRGAIQAGGRTIAVLASGVLNIYPPEHETLAAEVAEHGVLLSEMPPYSEPLPGAFPQRNRLISGLTLGTIVVEAAERSGALITARHAMEQGREVFAMPGNADSLASRGCHRLLRDGATLVESVDDVLEELGPLIEPAQDSAGQVVHHPAELLLNELEQKVLAEIHQEATSIDQIVSRCQLPISQVLATLSVLEMRRLVRRLSGATVIRP